jgi:hypothetical protein
MLDIFSGLSVSYSMIGISEFFFGDKMREVNPNQ